MEDGYEDNPSLDSSLDRRGYHVGHALRHTARDRGMNGPTFNHQDRQYTPVREILSGNDEYKEYDMKTCDTKSETIRCLHVESSVTSDIHKV